MAYPSVTYSFTNGTTADATQVNQNFTDIINGLSDGTKDLSVKNIGASGKITVTETTDSTSGSTGSINTLGGLGVTKAIYCGSSITCVTSVISPLHTATAALEVRSVTTLTLNAGTTLAINVANATTPVSAATCAATGAWTFPKSITCQGDTPLTIDTDSGDIYYFKHSSGDTLLFAVNSASARALQITNEGAGNLSLLVEGGFSAGSSTYASYHDFVIGDSADGNPVMKWRRYVADADETNLVYVIAYQGATAGTEIGGIWNDGSDNFTTYTVSDRRIKTDIIDSPYGLEHILQLQPRMFTKNGIPGCVGMVAQEVEDVIPWAVHQKEANGYSDFRMFSDTALITPMVQAIKDLHARIVALEVA